MPQDTSGIYRVFVNGQQLPVRAASFSSEGVVRSPDGVSDQAAAGNRVTPDVNRFEGTVFNITPDLLDLISQQNFTMHIQFGGGLTGGRVAIMTNCIREDNNPTDADINELDFSCYSGDPVQWTQ